MKVINYMKAMLWQNIDLTWQLWFNIRGCGSQTAVYYSSYKTTKTPAQLTSSNWQTNQTYLPIHSLTKLIKRDTKVLFRNCTAITFSHQSTLKSIPSCSKTQPVFPNSKATKASGQFWWPEAEASLCVYCAVYDCYIVDHNILTL